MAKTPQTDPKLEALRQQGCLHPHPERVSDPLFVGSDFFDARDLVQVKYEMVRRVQAEGQPVGQSAQACGFSRPSFYQAQAALEREGLAGLVPKKKGPRRAHKLGPVVLAFLQQQLAQEPSLRPAHLAEGLRERFQLQVHPRSIERALARAKKTPLTKDPTWPGHDEASVRGKRAPSRQTRRPSRPTRLCALTCCSENTPATSAWLA